MIMTKHKNGNIITDSSYDSGTHLGFTVQFLEDNSFTGESLDKLLSTEEIKSLEMILASVVKGYLEVNKNEN